MMVALVFTMVLMAGMATVFRSSLVSFYSSGETLSSARRNLMSLDLLGDDLDTAGMFLIDPFNGTPSNGIGVSQTSPPFFVLPNVAITGGAATPAPGDPTITDELYFYADQPLPFQGTIKGVPANSAATDVQNGVVPGPADFTYTVDCALNPAYAQQVAQGQIAILQAFWQVGQIVNNPQPPNGSQVTIVLGSSPTAPLTGIGPSGAVFTNQPPVGSGVLIVQPDNMIRYRLQFLQLDPSRPTGVPCLVRDLGTWDPAAGFTVGAQPQQIVADNVQGFKVYLSLNSGQTWAGIDLVPAANPPPSGSGFAANWQGGIQAELQAQWTLSGRPGTQPITTDALWFRNNPTLVRIDLTTRTATQRTEYSGNPGSATPTAAFKLTTQSLIYLPRQSGLTVGS
jgi:hypothetical protein